MINLAYKTRGEGQPLFLLHGLFGSGENLGGINRRLSGDYQTYAIDLRGHGRSPHAGSMRYSDMADDVLRVMDKGGLESAFVFGHSMGGKTAMQLALNHGDRVRKLVVGDIAPVQYKRQHNRILDGLQAVVEAVPESRKDAEAILSEYEDEPAILTFLAANWRRDGEAGWGWRLDLDAIVADYENIRDEVSGIPFDKETLFLRGGLSDYVLAEHRDAILKLFPKATVRTIEGTGHWLHAEKPDMVARTIDKFLKA